MDFVKVEYEKKTKVFWKDEQLDDNIAAIWRVAEKLDEPEETAFIKQLLLIAAAEDRFGSS